MKALILNSGMGSRMGELTQAQPKCMCPIGDGYTIVRWQLERLQANGIQHVVMTTGPFEDILMGHLPQMGEGFHVELVNNPDYRKTNYIYSIYLAQDLLKGDDILLLHGDLVLEDSVLRDLAASEHSAVAIDSRIPLPEKDFKARIAGGRIAEIGTGLFGPDCSACQPAYFFKQADFQKWLEGIALFCQAGKTGVYAEDALNGQLSGMQLFPLELDGRLCHEIDDLQDLKTVAGRFSEYRGSRDWDVENRGAY